MAELVDALDSKSGYRKVVQVRFLFWAQRQEKVLHIVRDFFMAATEACFGERTEKSPACEASKDFFLSSGKPPIGSRRNEVEPTVLFSPTSYPPIHIN